MVSEWESYVALSDIQAPLHDVAAVDAVIEFLADYQPDQLLCVGDEYDFTEISRWVRGRPGEYNGDLQAGIDSGTDIFTRLREAVGDVPFHLSRSNHTTTRLRNYVSAYAPALADLRSLEYLTLTGLGDLGVTLHEEPFEFAPGWVLAHGDEGSLSKIAGRTATGLAGKWGYSVVCGHTHRLGIGHEHQSIGGRISRYLFGVEAGNLMDMEQATYLGARSGNWQQGFAGLTVNRKSGVVIPWLVPIVNRSFTVEGQVYSW